MKISQKIVLVSFSILFFCSVSAGQALAAVAVDSVGPSSAGTSCTNCSSLNWSHTVSGTNTLLTVGVAVGNPSDTQTVAVTYNGVGMTSAGKVHTNNSTAGFIELFYLKSPATGTNTVAVTLTGGAVASIIGGSTSFTGVDQTTPVRNVGTNFGNSAAPSVAITSVTGDMVVDAVAAGCPFSVSGQTLSWMKSVDCATGGGNGAQSTAAGATSVTMNYTIPGGDYWGIIGMDVVATSGAPDTTPPSTPTSVSATAISSSAINLSWTASTDNVGVTGYKIFRGGVQIATSGTNSYSDSGLSPSTNYSYTVSAYDAVGNTSSQSSSASATTQSAPVQDTTPPSTPTNLSATAISSSGINLTWTASTDNVAVTGYKIFRGGVQIGTSATNNYSDSGLTASTNYSYTVSAYDAAGNNSVQSASASATTQAASGGQTITANSCSLTDVQAAVNNVSRNGTVNVPAGSCTWNSTVTITKGMTFSGAGIGNTVILNGGGDGTMLQLSPDATAIANDETIKVSGFTFDGNGTGYSLISVRGAPVNGTKPFKNLIITANRIQNTGSISGNGNTCIFITGGQTRGVIYSNIFDRCDIVLRPMGSDDTTEWSNTAYNNFSYGSADNLFFESNTILYSQAWTSADQYSGWIESGQGGRVVVRFNTWNMTNAGGQAEFWDVHGFQNFYGSANGQTGTMVVEYYNNAITNAANTVYRWMDHRGSLGFFVNNTYSGGSNPDVEVNQYNGGCTAQIVPAPSNYNPIVNNTYFIHNTVNGSVSNAITGSSNACGVAENAGFWNQNASFNGTTGIGYGVLSSRPSTCTTGVGYWATDQGSWNTSGSGGQGLFYKCTSTNTWSLYYTPYTYPHPLASGIAPPPDTTSPSVPTGVSATAISSSQINLSWTASSDNVAVTGYKIFRNGVQITTTSSTSYSDSGLSASTNYSYTISAYDAAGNNSAQSSSASATTQASATPIPGDLNLDHIVNTLDFSLLNSKWLQSYPSYDLYVDNIINSLDYAIMSSNWGKTW